MKPQTFGICSPILNYWRIQLLLYAICHLLVSNVTNALHTAGISNVESIECLNRVEE